MGRGGAVAADAAHDVGVAQAALSESVAYSQARKTFGKLICEHQAIQLKLGEMATRVEAARLLTRPFAIEGIVRHGDKLGRTIGYPTANLDLGPYLRPAYGIYAVRGRLPDGRVLGGAANLGIRPTFEPPKELLEPYFFDFSGDLYGQRIEVELVDYLRAEAKFDGLDALTRQMEQDCARARAVLA